MTGKICIGFALFVSLIALSCRKEKSTEDQRYAWSSEAPLSIPYRIRAQKLSKDNLLRNPSFETGRTFILNDSVTSFVIDSWQQVGRNIIWVDTADTLQFNDQEVFGGRRSVKILRTKAYETDEQGEGVMSDFIKVIPGHYSLSLYLKASDIQPVMTRLGIKMYDAINLRLLYFDRNKQLLSANARFDHHEQIINTSFKSLSFSNYSHVSEFGWGKIIGKSAHFPFPDGDIPSEAHYVKIFIGLKASGTLWIDSVDFRYTEKNFSIAERMQPYTDTTYILQESIIPSPKFYQRGSSVAYFTPGMKQDQLPLIVIPSQADPLILKAARQIQHAMNLPEERISHSVSSRQIESASIVFSLGTTGWFHRFARQLPTAQIKGKTQGYFIKSVSQYPNLVFLGANGNEGIYYAVQTLIQMFEKSRPVFHGATVIDYPDYPKRYCALSSFPGPPNRQSAHLESELTGYKLNGGYVVASDFSKDFSDHVFTVQGLPDEFSSQVPGYLTQDNSGALIFNNELLDLSEMMHPDCQNAIRPSAFYSGCSLYSLNTDDADIQRYVQAVRTVPIFMDNSMQTHSREVYFKAFDPWYPGKIRLYNLFEPFGNNSFSQCEHQPDPAVCFINFVPNSQIDLIRLATAADYVWNAAAYKKDLSLWKVLVGRYGSEAARYLLSYADEYGLMQECLVRMRNNDAPTRNLKTGQQTIQILDILAGNVSRALGAKHPLVRELLALNTRAHEELKQLLSSTIQKLP